MNCLLMTVEVERTKSAFVAQTRRFDAAERSSQIAHIMRVDPHHSGIDSLREIVRPSEVVRPQISCQSVADAIRQSQGFAFRIKWSDCDNGTEDFFLKNSRLWLHIGKHRWRNVVAGWKAFRTSPAGQQASLGFSDFDIAHDLVEMLGMDESPNFRFRISRIAN